MPGLSERISGAAYFRGVLILMLIIVSLQISRLLLPLDRIIYDTQIRFFDREPLADIIIVAIDLPSLEVFGRWPWSRDIHAKFLDKVSSAGPAVVVLDILFSEAAIPKNDDLLAQAIERNGKVVLPVAPEAARGTYSLIANLPLDEFQAGAAAIGHVDRELDLDAISRRTYLYAGLSGAVQWPAMALAAMQVAGDESGLMPRLRRFRRNQADSRSQSWVRSDEYLLPYAGKPGTFRRISYADVLKEDFDTDILKGKYVLIGVDTIGLGDVIPTPVSGESNPMPGIEVIANEIDALRQDLMITRGGFWPGLVITCLLVLCSYALWGILSPRYSLYCWAALVALIIIIDTWVLYVFRIWYAPATCILGISLGYLGWVWGRLMETVKYLNSELNRLGSATISLKESGRQDANEAAEFLMNMDGFHGGSVRDEQGNTLFEWMDRSAKASNQPSSRELSTVTENLTRKDGNWQINLMIDENAINREDATRVARQLTEYYSTHETPASKTPVEFIKSRIELVKAAHARLHLLSGFITEVLDQLHVGVVVTDAFGDVLLANRGAGVLLEAEQESLRDSGILRTLSQTSFNEEFDWPGIFSDVMFRSHEFIHEAHMDSGRYLLLEISRYSGPGGSISGMVFNIIDVTTLKQTEQSRRELLTFLSHDLRSPLASLIATSDLARLQPEYRDSDAFLRTIRHSAGRALHMADNFLALVRAEEVNPDSFSPVNLTQVINDEIRTIQGQARSKSIRVQHAYDQDARVIVNGDRSILERIINNLLINAVKYSPQGQAIEVGLSRDGDNAHCWVRDTGYGIRKSDREKIFGRFERGQQQDESEEAGIGLGLAFVRLSVERHRGWVELESEIGKGSCFHVYLPLAPEQTPVQQPEGNLSKL